MYKNGAFSSTGPIALLQTLLGNICWPACHLLHPHDKSPAALCTYSNRFEQSSAGIWLGNECSMFVPEVSRCSYKPAEPQDVIIQLNSMWNSSLCCLSALGADLIWVKAYTNLLCCYADKDKTSLLLSFFFIGALKKRSGFAIKCFEWKADFE